ncbi:hypothetical protein APHAL10511_005431 [Amanita phalloides]|nr:hypothetical protein APHAL10511_005431 [Amanita phalloides]
MARRSGSPDKSTRASRATGFQTTRVTRSQTAQLQATSVAVAQDPEPITINWLFFDKSRPPTGLPIEMAYRLFNGPFIHCRDIFVGELKSEHSFEANRRSVKFWKPRDPIPLGVFRECGWPETFTNVAAIAGVVQGAEYPCDVFQGDLDRRLVHLIVTAEGTDEAQEEARDAITGLPEINHFLKNIEYDGPAPSQGARSQNYVDIQKQTDGAIYDGRYPYNGKPTTAAPINIFHPIFEVFIRRLHRPTPGPTRRYLKLVREIMDLLTQIQRPEWKRGREFRRVLKEVLGRSVILETNDDQTCSDGSIVIEIAGSRIPICMMEIKVEGSEGGDPSIQAGLSIRRFWVTQENFFPIRDKTCCPTFLLAGGGAWLTVLGAVFTDRPVVQRLTDMLWMGNATTHREDRLLHLACMFLALRDSIKDLEAYYETIANDQAMSAFNTASNEPHPRFFPYITSIDTTKLGRIQFRYLGRLQDDPTCVTFRAQLVDGSEKQLVVKFVTTYNAHIHELLHQEGYAPELFYCGPIPTTGSIIDALPLSEDQGAQFRRLLPLMNVVVMEHVKLGAWPATRDIAEKQLKDVLRFLHTREYVFGDLREPNVLFTENGKLNLIDFDWAGLYKRNEQVASDEHDHVDWNYAHYPSGLSSNIKWASGVEDFAAIRPEHDEEMMIKILDNMYRLSS